LPGVGLTGWGGALGGRAVAVVAGPVVAPPEVVAVAPGAVPVSSETIERESSPRLRDASLGPASRWVDLTSEHCGIAQPHAFCDAVLVIEPGRRPNAHVTEVAAQRATDTVRRAWPITELHPFRKHGQLPMKLSQRCRAWQGQLSRRAEDLLVLLDSIRSPACSAMVTFPSASLSAAPASPVMKMAM